MKTTLKQNWKKYLKIVFLFFLVFYTPWVKSHVQQIMLPLSEYYLDEDFFSFSFNETLLITSVLALISFFFFYKYFFDDKDSIIKGLKSFSYAIVVGLLYALVIQHILISIGMQFNRIAAKEELIQDLEVALVGYYDVQLKSQKDNYNMSKDKFQKEDLSNLKVNDTIHIVFKKGIFGIKYMEDGKIRLKK